MHNGFEDLDLDRLRRRRSEKWRLHPPDVLPAFIAEMDYDLAEPVVAALREAVVVHLRDERRQHVRRVQPPLLAPPPP